jgi:hypothetical protein
MTDTSTSAAAEKEAPRRGYKAEQVADPLIGCVDFNKLHDELKEAEEQPELPTEAPASRGRRG